MLQSNWACMHQLLKPEQPRACALQQAKATAMRSLHTVMKSGPCSLQPEKACAQQQDPVQPKVKQPNKTGTFKKKSTTIIKKPINNKCWRGCGEKGICLYCWWECKLIHPLWRTVWRFLKKLKKQTTLWPSNPTMGHTPWANCNSKRHMYPKVHSRTIYNSQDKEAT